MVLSQNGWLANDRTYIATAQIPGAGFGLALRKGSATTVLVYVASRFHREVEPLLPGQCWGYAERLIRGSVTTVSNHASGTAIDCNSLKHPLAAVDTFTPAQRAAIHRILTDCRGLVRWGGDYSTRKDEMHFELVGNEAQINDLASRLTTSGSRIPNLSEEDDMFSDDDRAQMQETHARVMGMLSQRYAPDGAPARVLDTMDGSYLVEQINAGTVRAVAETSSAFHQSQATIAALQAALNALAVGQGVDPAAIRDAAEQGARAALADLTLTAAPKES